MPTMFLPDDVENAISALLTTQLEGIETSPIGEADIDDDDQLVLQLPCARPRYVATSYAESNDLTQTTYNVEHAYEIWCGAENLVSKEAQRQAAKAIVRQVLPVLAGARLAIEDGSGDVSAPVRLLGIDSVVGDVLGMIYIVRVGVPGIAQFSGVNA